MEERRLHRRLDMQLPVCIRSVNPREKDIEMRGMTKNISTGGAYLHCALPLKLDARVAVFLTVPNEIMDIFTPRILHTEASVIRVNGCQGKQTELTGFALHFVKHLEWMSTF